MTRLYEALLTDGALARHDGVAAMLQQIDRYHDKLFADPIEVQIAAGPQFVQPQRTNNLLERFLLRLARQVCRRTGRQLGKAALDAMLPDTPLVANLDSPPYVEVLLDGCETLAQRLSRVDAALLDATLGAVRRPRNGLGRKLRAGLRSRAAPIQMALLILRCHA